MPLGICFNITFMIKLFIDFKNFYELILIIEYISSNYFFIYHVIL